MWYIHGKQYDLSRFLDRHPGGRNILETCKGVNDLTAAFESYHSMSDLPKIRKTLGQFRTNKDTDVVPSYLFREDGFYSVVRQRVKKHFEEKSHKANLWLWLKSFVQCVVFATSFFFAFYQNATSTTSRMISAIISGHTLIQIGLVLMHDASHYALSRYVWINRLVSGIWNGMALWDEQLWLKHHSFLHHSYTGDTKLDPDVRHFKPMFKKIVPVTSKPSLMNLLSGFIIILVFPGMFLGQGLLYHLHWLAGGHLWRMPLPENYTFTKLEWLCKLFTLFSWWYSGSFTVVFSYIVGSNITYFMCILPDHDTQGTVHNHVQNTRNRDWGEVQVLHSANFATHNPWIRECFGGINYQIEHHLFPTICHVHHHEVQRIVKRTCREFDIAYVEYPSIYSACVSSVKQILTTNAYRHPKAHGVM